MLIRPSRITTMLLTVAVLCCLLSDPAGAAVVLLKNGDRISGRIVKMQERKLELDPDYSSVNMVIDWDDVLSITSDRTMSVKLYGDAPMPEDVGMRVRDRILLHALEEGGPIRLEDIRSINLAEQDYYGFVTAGGNQTSGNTSTQALNVNGTLIYRKDEHRFIVDGKYNRAQADGEDTANNGAFNVKYDYFLTRRLYLGGFNLTESDQFQNLSVRNSTGLLAGYDVFDSWRQLLAVGIGPALVYEDFTSTPSTVTPAATWAVRYELRLRGNDVILFHRQQGFQDLAHRNAFRINADQGIRIKIIGRWRLTVEYDVRYNSQPVDNKKTTDTNLILGLSYDIKP